MNHIYKGADLSFGHQLLRGGGKGSPEHLHGLVDFCIENVVRNCTILELGCFQGASTRVFSQFCKKVITVDVNFNLVNKKSMPQNVDYIQSSSLNLAKILESEKIFYDVLYIDTVHTEDHCSKELNSLYKYCKSEPKIIAGHDYHFPGIRKAVKSFFGRGPDKVYSDQSWVYKQK